MSGFFLEVSEGKKGFGITVIQTSKSVFKFKKSDKRQVRIKESSNLDAVAFAEIYEMVRSWLPKQFGSFKEK
jgi:hypothetical protein